MCRVGGGGGLLERGERGIRGGKGSMQWLLKVLVRLIEALDVKERELGALEVRGAGRRRGWVGRVQGPKTR